ncbi:F-box protein CPR1-like [Papaver somniferum]|uniref:F-box protein CPR1-like n=1 Tax=Papaver somniferum TaxID=3469 RepID=UPI000E6F968F|nr:F-box protein CPR1-like [Papaver somniferum]XP_026423731.1 F-box protein CPR1-like [Papaver somniferum]
MILWKPSFIKIHVNKSIRSNRSNPKLLFSHRWVLYSPKIYSVPIDYASISVASSSFLSVVYEGAVPMNYPFESNKMYHHQFLGSCNGLICFKFHVIDWGADYQRRREEETKYSVLNPLTRQFKEFTMQIVDRIGNGITYGFGYDSKIDDYKLVAILNNGDSSNIEVYKVRSNSQTSIRGTHKYWFYCGKRSCGVFLNGCLHWLGCTAPHAVPILCFDISNEIMLSIPLPEIIRPSIASPGEVHKSVGVLGDNICVVFWDSVRLNVWVMQEYRVKESWINLFTTSRVPSSNRMPSWKPLLCFDDGKILVDYEFEDLRILDPTTEAARLVGFHDIPMGDN